MPQDAALKLQAAGNEPSDEETRRIARYVEELFPDVLLLHSFEATIGPCLLGLDANQRRRAKARIYNALPGRLRYTIHRDLIARQNAAADARGELGAAADTFCLVCGNAKQPSLFVQEEGICASCWAVPENYGDDREMFLVDGRIWVAGRAPERLTDRRLRSRESGVS